MQISIAFAGERHKIWRNLEVADGTTIEQAIEQSGLLADCPEIDLTSQSVGVFSKLSELSATLKEGDRVEIYRDIIADEALPEQVEAK